MEHYDNPWMYNGEVFDPEGYQDFTGFIYLITNLTNGRKYVGQKKLWGTKPKVKRLKNGSKKTVKVKCESDWKKYYGSSEELKGDVAALGAENFKREILKVCRTKGLMNYEEMREQVFRDVLRDLNYYNSFIGGKIHRIHVSKDLEGDTIP
jgi:hypothetical protein